MAVRSYCAPVSWPKPLRLCPRADISFCDKRSGDDSDGETPVPIPNTEVKPASADGTALETGWESRSSPGLFFCLEGGGGRAQREIGRADPLQLACAAAGSGLGSGTLRAVAGLTSVFGMGTGVSPSLSSPDLWSSKDTSARGQRRHAARQLTGSAVGAHSHPDAALRPRPRTVWQRVVKPSTD